jgi:uncharacterized protein YbcI
MQEYVAFWRAHPAFAGRWTEDVKAYVRAEPSVIDVSDSPRMPERPRRRARTLGAIVLAFALPGLGSGRSHRQRIRLPVSPPDAQSTPRTRGDVLTAISDGIVALLKEFYGRGPTRTKSYYEDDLVVCLLRGGFTRVEQTLLEGGRGPAVIQQRMEFQELMRERFVAVIEHATGRRVIGFMSGNQQHPDIMCEVFILAPTDLVDDEETRDGGPSFAD